MRVPVRAALVVPAVAALTACGSVAAPMASGHRVHPGGAKLVMARRGPPAGSRAEAVTLARRMLSRLRLPAGARRLPPEPVPRPVRDPDLWGGAAAAVDLYELFELPQPVDAVANALMARMPIGMSREASMGELEAPPGVMGREAGVTSGEVAYLARSVPPGVYMAQLVVTVAPDLSGGSWVRVDAQVIWFPPRTAAEYIGPGRYHVLTLTVTLAGPRQRMIHKVVTLQAAITRVAEVLNSSPVQPTVIPNCPMIFADYRLAFAVSRGTRPAVVVFATLQPCEGAQVRARGRGQPPLQDEGAVIAIADRLLGFTPRP